MNLDGVCMVATATAELGVVDPDTRLTFYQSGSKVLGRYGGGRIARGCLVGTLSGKALVFRYVQIEASGEVHAGRSFCDLVYRSDGRLSLIEHFTWETRAGSGTNVFEQVLPGRRGESQLTSACT
jgi:hypothetical protein